MLLEGDGKVWKVCVRTTVCQGTSGLGRIRGERDAWEYYKNVNNSDFSF